MQKAVIFDLYDTLVQVEEMDFSRGLTLLYTRYMSGCCTLGQVKDYNQFSLKKYHSLHAEGKEYPFLSEEVADYYARFGCTAPLPDADFEYEFLCAAGRFCVSGEVRSTLQALREQGVYMMILSNSIYSSGATKRLLEELGIAGYFSHVLSSADKGICKPATAFFEEAIEKVRQDVPGIDKEDIVFVGDRYDLDCMGGCEAGLRTVWLNPEHKPNGQSLPLRQIEGLKELLSLLAPGRIVCIGDSLTEGDYGMKGIRGVPNVHSENYPYFLSLLTGAPVVNAGHCGWKSTDMLALYQSGGIDVKDAGKVIVMLGTNGGQSGSSESEQNDAYRELIRLIRRDAPGARVYLCTPPHVTEDERFINVGYAPQVL